MFSPRGDICETLTVQCVRKTVAFLLSKLFFLSPQAQTLQIDFLTKILPNYHYLMKPNTQPASRAAVKK